MADRPIEYAVHPATVRCSRCGQLRSGDPCGWCSNPFADVGGGPDKPPCGAGCGCALCVERATLACERALETLPPDVAVSTWERLAPGKRP